MPHADKIQESHSHSGLSWAAQVIVLPALASIQERQRRRLPVTEGLVSQPSRQQTRALVSVELGSVISPSVVQRGSRQPLQCGPLQESGRVTSAELHDWLFNVFGCAEHVSISLDTSSQNVGILRPCYLSARHVSSWRGKGGGRLQMRPNGIAGADMGS
jgi:hypothetical protein